MRRVWVIQQTLQQETNYFQLPRGKEGTCPHIHVGERSQNMEGIYPKTSSVGLKPILVPSCPPS